MTRKSVEVTDRVVAFARRTAWKQIGTAARGFSSIPPITRHGFFLRQRQCLPRPRCRGGRAPSGEHEAGHIPGLSHDDSRPAELCIRRTTGHRLGGRCSNRPAPPVCPHQPAGSVTRIQLAAPEFGIDINVDLTPDAFAELRLKNGDSATSRRAACACSCRIIRFESAPSNEPQRHRGHREDTTMVSPISCPLSCL